LLACPAVPVPRPDALLFNGGALKPQAFRAQIVRALQEWFRSPGWQPTELTNPSLDLAVALGAAYYGCVRRGAGLRIGGGIGRAYYIGIETDGSAGLPAGKAVVCLVPQGAEEGQVLALPQTFILGLGAPVVFPLFASSVRATDKLGALVDEDSADLTPLPPLETTLSAGQGKSRRDVAVRLHATLNAAGTLALALKTAHGGRSWEVHLNLRPKA
ncbi:MAG: molecular chaperone DnaK, partial [Planctomycetota bacterium]|nr:molecular chaperone DnaK [Planctomycetota bacterium]